MDVRASKAFEWWWRERRAQTSKEVEAPFKGRRLLRMVRECPIFITAHLPLSINTHTHTYTLHGNTQKIYTHDKTQHVKTSINIPCILPVQIQRFYPI